MAAKDGLLDDALDMSRLDTAVPDPHAGERMGMGMARTSRCCVRRDVDNHVAGPFVASDVGNRADIDGKGRNGGFKGRRFFL